MDERACDRYALLKSSTQRAHPGVRALEHPHLAKREVGRTRHVAHAIQTRCQLDVLANRECGVQHALMREEPHLSARRRVRAQQLSIDARVAGRRFEQPREEP